MRSAWVVLVSVLALGGCDGDPASGPEPAVVTPPSGLQHGLLARLAADPAVIAKLLSASAEPVVIRVDGVEFPRQAYLDQDYDRLFPPDVAHAIHYRDFALKPTDDELLALATAAAAAAAPSP